jgi:septum formation protein
LILASGSPQRRAILEQLGVAFTVIVSDVEELEAGEPERVALENARRKATAVRDRLQREPVGAETALPGSGPPAILGVDTVVELDGELFGKPADHKHARATLRVLSGATHRVISGVCVLQGPDPHCAAAVTSVTFRPLTEATIDWYLDTGEWQGRAGGYAIQGRGAALVSSLSGDYLNVVGLPVATLIDLLPTLLFPAVF